MNHDEMNEIREIWERTERRLSALEQQTARLAREESNAGRSTTLERLINRYRRFTFLGLVLTLLMVIYFICEILPGEFGRWVCLALGGMGLLCAAMDFNLYRRLSRINIYRMSVSRVAEIAAGCRKTHLNYMMITVPYCILCLGGMAWSVRENKAMLLGMVAGLIIGLAVGFRELKRFMDDYAALRDSDV